MDLQKEGWLINDCLTCIPGTKTFWHDLLSWLPNLKDKTNGYTPYGILPNVIENELLSHKPYYIIRNGTYFRRLYTDVKTISLIQDVQKDGLLDLQIDTINNSSVVVFNTNYVYSKYKSYINSSVEIKICPLGVNFDFFKPIDERDPDVLPNSIIFIGASTNYPKGFNILLDLIKNMTSQNFCLIMKDDFSINNLSEDIRDRVRIFNRVNQEKVRLLINSCICAICTSYEETQHLSGIECGACNIPIIARKVGVYYDCQNDNNWGVIADDTNFEEKIKYVLDNINIFTPREYFIEKYSTDICKNNWIRLVENL